jgi:hypothetical protein
MDGTASRFCTPPPPASAALDLGLVPGEGGLTAQEMAQGGWDVLFNLGADEIEIAPGAFVIYQGTMGTGALTAPM